MREVMAVAQVAKFNNSRILTVANNTSFSLFIYFKKYIQGSTIQKEFDRSSHLFVSFLTPSMSTQRCC